MKVKEIYNLLEEASTTDSIHRQNEIQVILQQATSNFNGNKYVSGSTEGITMVLSSLYNETLDNYPSLLPTLLPVFVLMCGDRKNQLIAEIDWQTIKQLL